MSSIFKYILWSRSRGVVGDGAGATGFGVLEPEPEPPVSGSWSRSRQNVTASQPWMKLYRQLPERTVKIMQVVVSSLERWQAAGPVSQGSDILPSDPVHKMAIKISWGKT